MANGNQQPQGDSQVEVYSPQLKLGTIPSSQMVDAIAQGYKPKSAYVEAVHPTTGKTGIIPREQWDDASKQGFILSPREQQRVQMKATAQTMQPTPSLGQRLENWYTTPTQTTIPGNVPGVEQEPPGMTNTPQQTFRRGAAIEAGLGLPALGVGAVTHPLATILGLAGGTGGGYLGKKGVQAAGGGQLAQDIGETGGSIVGGTVAGMIGEGGQALLRGAIQRLSGATPAELAAIEQNTQYEARIAQRIVGSEDASRTGFKNAYDALGIDAEPVNMAGPKNLAQAAVKSLPKTGASVPRPVSTVARLPEPSEANLPDYILAQNDPNEVLAALAKSDTIPFRQAQQTRAAIGEFISRAGRLPTETYNALQGVSNAIGGGLAKAADNVGKLGDYQAADAMFKQHAADYWNDNAPLASILDKAKAYVGAVRNNQQPEAGSVLNEIKDPSSAAQVVNVMQRRKLDTSEIQQLVSGGKAKLGKMIDNIGALSLSKQFGGPEMFNRQVAAANRAQAIKMAVRGGAGVIGGGALGELIRWLATRPRQ